MLPGGEHFQACLKFKRNVAGKSHPVIVSRDISPLLCIQKIPLSPRPPVSLAFPHTRILMGSSMCPTTEKVEVMTDFIFLGSKITENNDCSHEIKRYLLLERKVVTNLDSILKKQRHYFANKAMISPVVMYGCES